MAWAHEKARVRKPADRASEVSAVDGENLEALSVDISNPTGDVCSLAIGRSYDGIAVRGEARLAGRKLLEPPESNPRVEGLAPVAHNGREEITQDRCR
jgi:hypothetical protein